LKKWDFRDSEDSTNFEFLELGVYPNSEGCKARAKPFLAESFTDLNEKRLYD
jgi:hypothetical protein